MPSLAAASARVAALARCQAKTGFRKSTYPARISKGGTSRTFTAQGKEEAHQAASAPAAMQKGSSSEPGSWLIGFGGFLLALSAVDFGLQQYYAYADKERTVMVREMQNQANQQNPRPASWRNHARRPVLFLATIAQTERSLDGTHMLTGVSKDDVVEVLEEGVGPGDRYCLCRVPDSGKDGKDVKLGWYLTQHLSPQK